MTNNSECSSCHKTGVELAKYNNELLCQKCAFDKAQEDGSISKALEMHEIFCKQVHQNMDVTVKEMIAFKIGFMIGQKQFPHGQIVKILEVFSFQFGLNRQEFNKFLDDLIERTMDANEQQIWFQSTLLGSKQH